MNDPKTKTPEKPELVDDIAEVEIEDLFPSMDVQEIVKSAQDETECIVGDDQLLGLYEEILGYCRSDRDKADESLLNFADMVLNEGDASSASKEAIVNLIKIKSDTTDKMSKIADLMTRIKLKEKDTFPRYLAAQQNNKVVIESDKREMIKSINKIKNASKRKHD